MLDLAISGDTKTFLGGFVGFLLGHGTDAGWRATLENVQGEKV
jgi:hypothetical protein